MKMRGWVAAIALVVAVNAFVLLRVAANRRGQPDAVLTLTERDLPVESVSPQSESSAVSLRFDVDHFAPWSQRSTDRQLDPLAWLDGDKLATLGFRLPLPGDSDEADLQVQEQLPRAAFAVLELGGPAGARYRARLAEHFSISKHELSEAKPLPAPEGSDRRFALGELRFGSRLFIVDVGTDPAALRRRYPDGNVYLIAPAEVRAFMHRSCEPAPCAGQRGQWKVSGLVSLLIGEVNVPRPFQPRLPAAQADAGLGSKPRYEVVLASGKHYEPWIREIRPLTTPR